MSKNVFWFWFFFNQFLFYFAWVIWDNCSVKPTILKTFCHFHECNLQFNMECLKYKALKMTFGRGLLLSQKYNILKKRMQKLPTWLWKYIIWKEKDKICSDKLFSMAQYTWTEDINMFEVDWHCYLSFALRCYVTFYVVLRECRKNWIL